MLQKKIHTSRNKAGFTLLELLVVVAIIGFLSSISILALSSSQEHGRDVQRKLDQQTIVKAAELYVNDFGVPPTQLCITDDQNPNVCKNLTSFGPTTQKFAEISRSDYSSFLNKVLRVPTAEALKLYQRQSCEEDPTQSGCTTEDYGGSPCSSSCGDGFRECAEQCDLGSTGNPKNGSCPSTCSTSCTINSCPVCGNGDLESGEQCDGTNLNNATCITQGFSGGTLSCSGSCQFETTACTTTPAGPCNGINGCEPTIGENIDTCPLECGMPVGGSGSCDLDGTCETGETPGNCSQDCSNISMCYVGGQWDLCCAFGTNCPAQGPGGQPTGGNYASYYGVCNGTRCEQRYLLQAPAFECGTDDAKCTPSLPNSTDKFVPSNKFAPNWLKGLEPYMPKVPTDPGRHSFNAPSGTLNEDFDNYYVSSNPDIVGRHLLCVWVSFERMNDNFNPYNDLVNYPTGGGIADSLYWTPLCIQ